ncbi:SagB/ThcOx family dehydrogenase [Synechococcus sp. PCC 6312]|uniref:SagB/ThcOx family dehydrogenase n=1 Tax=Synechococcus sp. (strain ATCC 27167 / PCC 6312) TaxID=195253 RepID=UPI00029EE886|nr:SagB/ThcOx family dehydrogenase [Synechococcus sp. PCC 6312]AFY61667.1 SagB-type dehydrogenase domain protein [Synechococcus sp. PCC 6312]
MSLAQHYHERTKYDPVTIRQRGKALDFSQQPIPYKDYKFGHLINLKQLPADLDPNLGERLSRFFYLSYGITAAVATPGDPYYLRAAPSAGGLYPAELYLIARQDSCLPAGLYNYQARPHGLIHFWESNVWSALQSACFWHPVLDHVTLAVVLTAVFYRSAWRYEDRAYRRIGLDSGHLLGNIELAANLNDFRAHLLGGFVDSALNDLLYLDSDQEAVLVVIGLADLLKVSENLPHLPTVLPSPICPTIPKIADGDLLHECHQASQITATDLTYIPKPQADPDGVVLDLCTGVAIMPPPEPEPEPEPEPTPDLYDFPGLTRVHLGVEPINWQQNCTGLENTILRRRSTRVYSGGSITQAQLAQILDFAYHPEHYQPQGLDETPDYFCLNLIKTFVAVSEVKGLEAGCYYYAPQAKELRQIRFKNFRTELHHLSLGQELGRDAAAVVFQTANLEAAITELGERAYRYLHMDAGHLGQRLNLAAMQLNLGASGIAGFFDDQVNEVLGIPVDDAVLYLTTLGVPA